MEELKKCTRCGEEKPLDAFTKNGSGAWCKSCHALKCKNWRDKKRGKPSSRNYASDAEIQQWRQCVAETGSITQTAARFGVSPKTVQHHTHDVLQKYKSERNAKILELRQNGMTMDEIADALNITEGIVGGICKVNGYGGRVRSGWENKRDNLLRANQVAIQKLRDKGELTYKTLVESLGCEYLGGYTNSDGYINVRYLQCGHDGRLSCTTLRSTKQVRPCAICAEEQRQFVADEMERKKAEAKEAARIEREAKEAADRAEREAKRHRICKECGLEFVSSSGSYCSDQCRRRSANRQKEAKRRGYKQKIPLTKLYSRDGGTCYICGCSCDFNDYEMIDGAFVVGPSYPTVEHVIPLCRGGDDSWENVKLACHKCNSAKSTKSLYQVKSSGQIAWAI